MVMLVTMVVEVVVLVGMLMVMLVGMVVGVAVGDAVVGMLMGVGMGMAVVVATQVIMVQMHSIRSFRHFFLDYTPKRAACQFPVIPAGRILPGGTDNLRAWCPPG
jgi:hypothetical protein